MKDVEIIRQLQNNVEEHKTIMEKIDLFGEKLEEMKLQLTELPEKIFDRADQKYASKTAERVIYGMVGIIITAFVVAVWEVIKGNI